MLRELEKRISCQVSIDDMQFGFMPDKRTTDAIFIMRQVHEMHQARKKLYYGFEITSDSLEEGGDMGFEEDGSG